MTRTRYSIPVLLGIPILAVALVGSPVAFDGHTIKVGDKVAFARGGGSGGGGGPGGPGGGMGPGAGQGMGMHQGPAAHGGMTQQMRQQMMSRETIRSVQRRLNRMGYAAGPVDGMMGPRTRMAIMSYQRDMGMASSGMLTPDLVDHMMHGPAPTSAN